MLFIHIRVNILDVVTKYDYQQCMNFEPHAAAIISRKTHITENCNQIWLTINNVDNVLLNVNYVEEPMVFNSCDWNLNIHDWKSGAYYAYLDCMPHAVVALWLKPRSHIACNRSATSLRPNFGWSQGGCRVVARRSATGHRPVAGGCRDDFVARRVWLLQVKPLCDQIDRRNVFVGRRQSRHSF